MINRITTFAFEAVDARPIDVEVQVSGGANAFNIVGLANRFRPAIPARAGSGIAA